MNILKNNLGSYEGNYDTMSMPEADRAWRRKEADQNFGWWNNHLASNTNQSFLDLLSLFLLILTSQGCSSPVKPLSTP